MLRHALGLEGAGVTGGVSLAGTSWASDLLRAANGIDSDLNLRQMASRVSFGVIRGKHLAG